MDSKPYKMFLQDKLKEWYNLYAAVRPTPKVGRLSVASLGDGDEDGAAERDEGEEGRIWGELPSLYPPKTAAESGQRARKKEFHIHDFIVDFTA